MATVARSAGHPPAVLYEIDWTTYTRLLRTFEKSGRRVRLTYDRGTLEIMSPLWEHERPSYLFGSFIDVLTDELNLPRLSGGSVTLRRKKKHRGLEPDKCYWIASSPRLQGKRKLDLRTDPPPDLAIEVDVTSSSMNRMGIYAALGLPEVWRLTKEGLTFHILEAGKYQVRPNSLSFPTLAAAELSGFLAQVGQADDTTLVRQFREWVRQNVVGR
jgi:Uma2 family endonuclease